MGPRVGGPRGVRSVLGPAWLSVAVGGFVIGACAHQEPPRGGPEDRRPPLVIETEPDTFATVEVGLRKVVFRFNERISERPAGGSMDDAVLVSPATGNVRVSSKRDAVEVSLQGGFIPDQVYRITLLPVISDMFGNRLTDPFDLIVSTGADPIPNVIAGAVEDRVTGRPLEGARVEAVFGAPDDSVAHWNFTSADGIYSLRYAPTGPYELRVWEDRNRNGELDPSEPRSPASSGELVAPIDTSFSVVSLIEPDTSAAVLLSVEVVDSATVKFTFDDYLDPLVDVGAATATLADSVSGSQFAVTLLQEADFADRQGAQPADTAVVDEALLQDTTAAALAGDTTESAGGLGQGNPGGFGAQAGSLATPARRVGLSGLVLPSQSVFGLVEPPLTAGSTYLGTVSGITNIAGTSEGGGERSFTWELPPPPDSVPADSIPGDLEPPPDSLPVDTLPARRVRGVQGVPGRG
ncbi:MAG: hypothetical protein ACR2QM_09470 [Longimicrobiales bacterium]